MGLTKHDLKIIVMALYMLRHSDAKPCDKEDAKWISRNINLAVMANGGWEEIEHH